MMALVRIELSASYVVLFFPSLIYKWATVSPVATVNMRLYISHKAQAMPYSNILLILPALIFLLWNFEIHIFYCLWP